MRKIIKNLIFKMFYRVVDTKDFGRCINCEANTICGFHVNCKAGMRQHYKQKSIQNLIEKI